MQLAKKKSLAAKVLGIGKGRVIFVEAHLQEIKEAITRQDILDLHKSGAIEIREVKGRKKIVRRKHRRRTGKIKMKVNNRKQEYVIITRKLRKFVRGLIRAGKIDKEKNREVRRMIRARKFKSKRHLKESLETL
jgi:large subunit ribosomal protein L19e|tara:strand:- start:64 stop:465 length:402 start_codon:yes stop_codon:yes gene_type:complete